MNTVYVTAEAGSNVSFDVTEDMNLGIGTVTTGDPNTPASASITGESPNKVLNLVIPRGADGQDGADGTNGVDGVDGQDGAPGTGGGLTEGDVTDFHIAPDAAISSSKIVFQCPGGVARPLYAKMLEFVAIEDFGAFGDDATDDTAAFLAWIADLQEAPKYKGYILSGRWYRVQSEPPPITKTLTIEGPGGPGTAGFIRAYNGSPNRGLFHLAADSVGAASSSKLSGFCIAAEAGTTGGALISLQAGTDFAPSACVLEDLRLSTRGTDTTTTTLLIDGSAKTTGAIGVRETSMKNVQIFGSTSYSAYIVGAIGLDWHGGGVYGAGGSTPQSGGIKIGGTAAVKSYQVTTDLNGCGGINITDAVYCRIGSRTIGAVSGVSVSTAATAQYCEVVGQFGGTVTGGWLNSGVRRPGQAWSAT